MKPTNIEYLLRKRTWNANKKSVDTEEKVSSDILRQVKTFHQAGKYEEAKEIIESQPKSRIENDARALSAKALILIGTGNSGEATSTLYEADDALLRERANIWINLTLSLIKEGRIDEAIAAGTRARKYNPSFFATHLSLLAAHASERTEESLKSIRRVIAEMKILCPTWNQNMGFWDYIMTDIDYLRVRELPDFEELFGDIPINISMELKK